MKQPKPNTSTERVRALERRLKADGGMLLRVRLSRAALARLDAYRTAFNLSRSGAIVDWINDL